MSVNYVSANLNFIMWANDNFGHATMAQTVKELNNMSKKQLGMFHYCFSNKIELSYYDVHNIDSLWKTITKYRKDTEEDHIKAHFKKSILIAEEEPPVSYVQVENECNPERQKQPNTCRNSLAIAQGYHLDANGGIVPDADLNQQQQHIQQQQPAIRDYNDIKSDTNRPQIVYQTTPVDTVETDLRCYVYPCSARCGAFNLDVDQVCSKCKQKEKKSEERSQYMPLVYICTKCGPFEAAVPQSICKQCNATVYKVTVN